MQRWVINFIKNATKSFFVIEIKKTLKCPALDTVRVDVDIAEVDVGTTPLLMAAETDDKIGMARMLLEAGASVNWQESRAGPLRFFLPIVKNDFFYQVNNLFLHQSYLVSQ